MESSTSNENNVFSGKLPGWVIPAAGIVGLTTVGGLVWYLSGSSAKKTLEAASTEIVLVFDIQRRTETAQSVKLGRKSSSDMRSYKLQVWLGSTYFYTKHPLKSGEELLRVYFFDGEHKNTMCEFFPATNHFTYVPFWRDLHAKLDDARRAQIILEELAQNPALFQTLQESESGIDVDSKHQLKAWEPLEKQTACGLILKEDVVPADEKSQPGTLFRGRIAYSHFSGVSQPSPSSSSSSSSSSSPSSSSSSSSSSLSENEGGIATASTLQRLDSGVRYQWAQSQEVVTEVKPLSDQDKEQMEALFSSEHKQMLKKFYTWLFHVHPEIREHILRTSNNLPFDMMWHRFLRNEDTVEQRIVLESANDQESAADFQKPAAVAGFTEVICSTPDTKFNSWVESLFVGQSPPSEEAQRVALNARIERAYQSNDELVLLDALLALQEFNLQFTVAPADSINQDFERLAGKISKAQHPNCSRYVQVVQMTLTLQVQAQMGMPPPAAAKQEILQLVRPLHNLPLEKKFVLGFWEAPVTSSEEATRHYQSVLSRNPYLVGVWIWMGVLYAEKLDLEAAWVCWSIARQYGPTYPLITSQVDRVEHEIRIHLQDYCA